MQENKAYYNDIMYEYIIPLSFNATSIIAIGAVLDDFLGKWIPYPVPRLINRKDAEKEFFICEDQIVGLTEEDCGQI